MATRKTTLTLTGAALALALAVPTWAQTTPAAPPDTTPPPAASTPAPSAPDTAPPAPPPPTEKRHNHFRVGPEVGVFLPTSSKARSQFGSAWLTLGLGVGSINQVTQKGQTALDLQVLYQSRNGNHAFLAPIGIGYRTALSQSGADTVYVGATADLVLADIRSGDYNVHSGLRTGAGASALLGVNFGESGFLEARYLGISRIKSFDLSGLNFTAGYRF